MRSMVLAVVGLFVACGPSSAEIKMAKTASYAGGYRRVPKTFQHISGSPKPRELAPDDPNLPGWVQGRVETLYVEIHKSLQKYQVK